MSGALQPLPPSSVPAVDPKTGLLTTAFATLIRSLWASISNTRKGVVSLGSVAAGATGSGSVTFASPMGSAPTIVLVSSSSFVLSVGANPASFTASGFSYTYENTSGSALAAAQICWRAE
jgi:hypothetical protein